MSERDPSNNGFTAQDYMAAWMGKLDATATQELSSPEQKSLNKLASILQKIIKKHAPLKDLGVDSSDPFCHDDMPEDSLITSLPCSARPKPNIELGITSFIFDENDKINGKKFCLSIMKFADSPVYKNGEPKGEFDADDQTWTIKDERYVLQETDSGWTLSGRELVEDVDINITEKRVKKLIKKFN